MSFFTRLFNFKEHAVGLDLNYGRIVATHFVQDGSAVLNRLAVDSYDPEMPDKELALKIRSFWKKEKLPSRTVCTCLHSRALAIRPFFYKNLTREDLPKVLLLEAEEALQKKPAEIAMDWHLSPSGPDEEAGRRTELFGLLTAAPRKTVQRHLNLIKAAGLYAISVEISPSAVHRFYAFLMHDQKPEPVCLINLADRTADVIVCSNGSCYPRTIFSAEDGWESNLGYLAGSVQDAMLFYEMKSRYPSIKRIVLTGTAGAIPALAERIRQTTALPVEIWNVLDGLERAGTRLQASRDIPENYSLTAALGLGLRRPAYEHG
jgi:Tfp pilus assembly PilM family ATPase